MNPSVPEWKSLMRHVFVFFFTLAMFAPSLATGKKSTAMKTWKGKTAIELIRDMDARMRGKSSIQEMTMKIVTPRWKRTLQMNVWSKCLNLSFVRI